MKSANLEQAVAVGVKARVLNNGQSCIAAKRFIVAEAIADEFERMFVKKMEALKVGDPFDETYRRWSIGLGGSGEGAGRRRAKNDSSGSAVADWRETVESARKLSTCLRCSTDIPEGSPAACGELFGPVASLFRAQKCGRCHSDRERQPIWPGRQRLDQRPRRARKVHQRTRIRDGVHQPDGGIRSASAFRRSEAIRPRARARRCSEFASS